MATCERSIILSLTLFCLIANAKGQTDESLAAIYGDEEFVSIATGISQPVSKAPAVASVITSSDIRKMGALDIDDVLTTIPGLHVAKSNIGYNPIYVFRGIYSDFNPQVLILINNIPITNLFHGDRGLVWSGMPIEAISRIEIIRGPGSAIYGADAFAGVINIITKSSIEIEGTEVGGRAGSSNTGDGWLQHGGYLGDLHYAAVIEAHHTDGHEEKITSDFQTFLDAITGTTASIADGPASMERDNLDARIELAYQDIILRVGTQIRDGSGNGAGIAQALDPNNRFIGQRWNADLNYVNDSFSDNWGVKAQASAFFTSQEVDKDLILFPPGSTGPFLDEFGQPLFGIFPNGVIGNPEVFERHYRGNVTGNYRGLKDHDITIGTGYYFGEIYKTKEEKNFGFNPHTGLLIDPDGPLVDVSDTPFVFLNENERENTFVFVQDVWHFANDWELTSGVRFDHYSDFGDTVNPRIALVWSARHNMTIKALYGEAFRAPSFAEMGEQANPSFLGNNSLEPETLKSYELAVNYRPAHNLVMDFNVFSYKWSDIIQFIPDSSGTSRTAQNAGEQTGFGFEYETKWSVTDTLNVVGNMAWQKSTDEDADEDAANSPEKQMYFRVNWDFLPNYSANIQANWVMDRNRDYRDPRKAIDDYVLVDLTLRRTNLFGNFELALLAKNIFDEDAREPTPNGEPVPFIPNDLPLAGRSLLGEIRYKF